jgi:hypothetical protein
MNIILLQILRKPRLFILQKKERIKKKLVDAKRKHIYGKQIPAKRKINWKQSPNFEGN